MNVTRQNLIDICDQFLAGQIDKISIQNFAWNAICDDNFRWDEDEIISDTIFEWDNEDINYEINKTNIQLWRKKLISEIDDLQIYNDWNSHISKQKEICGKYGSQWKPINKKLKIGISESLDNQPIHGLRHPKENGTTGWFIWSGDYIERDDFFKPICAEHLLQRKPEIIKYLGLDVGYRFRIDDNGYEDIWLDEQLTII